MKEEISLDFKTILVTGAAGFVGYYLVKRLLAMCEGAQIIGVDNFTDYYDVSLKEWRVQRLQEDAEKSQSSFLLKRCSIAEKDKTDALFATYRPHVVVNLAAQAGVRYSIDHPDAYITANLVGFYNILEGCRHDENLTHLVYASSSSVYGGNTKVPFATTDPVDHPVSLYAATKKSNELLAHSYAKLYDIPATGLRFFTVYGPAGRPDMAYFSFTERLVRGEAIDIFNFGNCERDFTYIDDIIEGVVRVMQGAPAKETGADGLPVPPYAVYNIGGGHPENLMVFVKTLAKVLTEEGVLPADFDVERHLHLVPMQPGDVPVTYADSAALEKDYGFTPEIDLYTGLKAFAQWYRTYKER